MRLKIALAVALCLTLPLNAALAKSARSQARAERVLPVNADLAAAVAHPSREKDRARDAFRKPDQTLAFFQVGPEMKVGEYAPGGGWYSRLLGL